MYADRITAAMKHAHRRDRAPAQDPGGVQQGARDHAEDGAARDPRHARQPPTPTTSTSTSCRAHGEGGRAKKKYIADVKIEDIPKTVAEMRKQMHAAAEDLDFEKAADLRDRIKALEAIQLAVG